MNLNQEKNFYDEYCSEKLYGKYHYLIGHFITGFRTEIEWSDLLLPYLYSLENRTGIINDRNSFEWGGTVCFRYDYLMILDESINQIDRRLPGLLDESGSQVLNEEYEWLLDTEYIKKNYTEYVIIPIGDFIQKCRRWIEIINSPK